MKLWERIIDHRIRQIVELDLVVVEKERNTGAVCRHNTGHTGYSDESENTLWHDRILWHRSWFTSRVCFEPAIYIYTKLTKIEEFVCPPNISEIIAVRTVKLARRPHIASTTIKLISKLLTAYVLSTSRASSLELVYAKQPILGLTQEFCWVRAWVGG